ncbi:hypothetical protein FB567DRAFT_505138 [Paraphoma chrysanthemicola]|uniref:Uncharacterized protein n=1 Tax=Paraphoma chrysanthemicola TaxID=798071 RepID=A0A8K0QXY0_9PLEO|nr:hypothetical protein FB567DRAFT_505138 [Paraphoma chrysanthemicola]
MQDKPVNAQPSIFDFTFEDYKAAGLNIAEQHALIGKIREEVPLIDRDEIDGLMLSEAAKQLELCVFPMCKMMHVDPRAVKRMLDREFRKTYGEDLYSEEDVEVGMGEMPMDSVEDGMEADMTTVVKNEELFMLPFAREESSMFDESSRGGSMAPAGPGPAKKRAKRAPLSTIQKDIRAHQAKRKKQRKGCRVTTLKSRAVAEKWASFESSTSS